MAETKCWSKTFADCLAGGTPSARSVDCSIRSHAATILSLLLFAKSARNFWSPTGNTVPMTPASVSSVALSTLYCLPVMRSPSCLAPCSHSSSIPAGTSLARVYTMHFDMLSQSTTSDMAASASCLAGRAAALGTASVKSSRMLKQPHWSLRLCLWL